LRTDELVFRKRRFIRTIERQSEERTVIEQRSPRTSAPFL